MTNLNELANEIKTVNKQLVDFPTAKEKRQLTYTLGCALRDARAQLPSNQAFGDWCSGIMPERDTKTLYRYRQLADFGDFETCEFVGFTNVYKLAAGIAAVSEAQVHDMLEAGATKQEIRKAIKGEDTKPTYAELEARVKELEAQLEETKQALAEEEACHDHDIEMMEQSTPIELATEIIRDELKTKTLDECEGVPEEVITELTAQVNESKTLTAEDVARNFLNNRKAVAPEASNRADTNLDDVELVTKEQYFDILTKFSLGIQTIEDIHKKSKYEMVNGKPSSFDRFDRRQYSHDVEDQHSLAVDYGSEINE